MGLIGMVPLTEAATFTVGCALLRTGRLDQDHVGVTLGSTAVLLIVGLLIAPESISIDPNALDPAAAWPLAGGVASR